MVMTVLDKGVAVGLERTAGIQNRLLQEDQQIWSLIRRVGGRKEREESRCFLGLRLSCRESDSAIDRDDGVRKRCWFSGGRGRV